MDVSLALDDSAVQAFIVKGVNHLKRGVAARYRNKGLQVAKLWKKYLIDQMSKPKTGRLYPKPGGGMYVASAPHEYPAIRTGNLAEAIETYVDIDDDGNLIVELVVDESKAPYAEAVAEIRPFIQDSKEELLDLFEGLLKYHSNPNFQNAQFDVNMRMLGSH